MLNAKLYLPVTEDERRAERRELGVPATLRDPSAAPFDVVIVNLSTTGFRIRYGGVLRVGDRIRIGISGVGVRTATVIRAGADYGCRFDQPIDPDRIAMIPGANTVLQADFQLVAPPLPSESLIERWPGWARVAILTSLTMATWTAIFLLAR